MGDGSAQSVKSVPTNYTFLRTKMIAMLTNTHEIANMVMNVRMFEHYLGTGHYFFRDVVL